MDLTALIWDATGRVDRKPAHLSPRDLEALWIELTSEDGAKAYEASQRLMDAAEQSVPFLATHLEPSLIQATSGQIARWIAELDSSRFQERQRSSAELEKLGEQAEVPLRKALAGKPSLEVRQRIERLLDRIEQTRGPRLSADNLRFLRAVEALEHMKTPQARKLLEKLASGAAFAWQTVEAKAALDRLSRLAALSH